MSDVIYFDNNATTRIAPPVYEAMAPYLTELYGNPSSIHSFGSRVGRALDRARTQVAGLLGAGDEVEVLFTSCGSEGDNTAIRGILEGAPDKRHFITTAVEHPAVLGLGQHLEKKGYRVTWLGVDENGMLDLEELRDSLSDDTALVSIMYANNETGVVFPVREAGEIVKARGIPFHVDAVQVPGKVELDVKDGPIDLLTVSAHKFHGPKGVGALYVRRGITLRPFIVGGHQERNRRAGTENVAGIVGMGEAAELTGKDIAAERAQLSGMRDQLESALAATCPGARIDGGKSERLPNTLNIAFEYLEGESILVLLDEFGICASTGSACTAGSVEPSHVLRAMKVPPQWLQGAVRFSLSRYNTETEIDFAAEKIPGIIRRLQGLSALGRVGAKEGLPGQA